MMTYRIHVVAMGFSLAVATFGVGCALQQEETMASLDGRINCRTAEGDIRVLQSEKATVIQQAAEGVTAIAPAGIVVGMLAGTEETKVQVATGDYNARIDARIQEIRARCGVR
jgi:hypothetical protein